ncbi:CRISPR-associated protein Cas4 [Alienimonas sp. DA493]|uniref:CRISPR-associated protein Cas4 n=1 Tax=Alienimonas sp. DA493 TaxID=3373605 RepID=UPI0037553AA9
MPDPLPISALQHLVFCERQCALIHTEGLWAENRLTAEGTVLHENAHEAGPETHGGVRVARGLDLRSEALNLVGKSDVVEFLPPEAFDGPIADSVRAAASGAGPPLTGWGVLPVEYKRGRPKTSPEWGDCDRVQLCAQALCLEEMLGVEVPEGRLFYGKTRRRTDVPIDGALRDLTRRAVARLHALLASGETPPAVNDSRCPNCSLVKLCLPQVAAGRSARTWMERRLASLTAS